MSIKEYRTAAEARGGLLVMKRHPRGRLWRPGV
jgi:hypothetical protein